MEINVNDLKLFNSYQLIDVRENIKYKKYHIAGSINVEYSELLINPMRYLEKKKEYLIICDYGLMSKRISKILNNMGYLTKSLSCGIKEYQRFNDICKKN